MSKHSEKKIYRFDNFHLSAGHSMLYREGAEISLPPKAVQTLLVLVRRSGEILSKDELMETIWTDSIVEESNLSQYLHLLRKTLGARPNGGPYIETLRRRGYRFTADISIADSSKSERSNAPGDHFQFVEASEATGSSTESKIIGRDKQIAEIAGLLGRRDVRLLTLTGIGGVGKTTLAQTVAGRLRDKFSDGVMFVELASITKPEGVVSAIASMFCIREATGRSALEILKSHFCELEVLLILDNFEQVVSAAPIVAELLAAARNLKIFITSRVLLHLRAEHEFCVPPLDLPPRKLAADNEVSGYEAIRLFVTRARNVKPGFFLSNENAATVAEICSRLDGLPLAIELAAARIKLMPVQAILERLNSQLKFLTGGAQDLPQRQQTMRAMVDWSYDLLKGEEKTVFRRLAVFAGGFTLEAAEGVAGRGPEGEFKIDVLDLITSLLDKGLLVSKDQNGGNVRFRMLEVVREYALEALESSGESQNIQRCHAEYFLALGEEAEPQLQAAQSADWLNTLEDEHDNLRAALDWSIVHDLSSGQRLAGSIWRFWWLQGHIREGCEQLGAFLSHTDAADGAVQAKMLSGAGALNRLIGNSEGSRTYAKQGLALAQTMGDSRNTALSLHQLGFLAIDAEDYTVAESLFEEALIAAKAAGDKQILGLLLNGLGEISRSREDYVRAADFYGQALAVNREVGDLVRQTTCLINLGATALSQRDLETAGLFYRDGLKISSKMVDTNGALYCLEGVAGAYWAVHEPERAALIFGASEALRESNNLLIEHADQWTHDLSVGCVRDSLSERVFDHHFLRGRKLRLDEAVEIALAETNIAGTGTDEHFSNSSGRIETIQRIKVE